MSLFRICPLVTTAPLGNEGWYERWTASENGNCSDDSASSKLLVLDEATSALDVDTERLTANLMDLYQDSTVFFITHRLASLKSSDHILVMDQGALVEQGTHEDLMKLDGRYATLFHQQEM